MSTPGIDGLHAGAGASLIMPKSIVSCAQNAKYDLQVYFSSVDDNCEILLINTASLTCNFGHVPTHGGLHDTRKVKSVLSCSLENFPQMTIGKIVGIVSLRLINHTARHVTFSF